MDASGNDYTERDSSDVELRKPLEIIEHFGDRASKQKELHFCKCLLKHCPMEGAIRVHVAALIEDVRQYVNQFYPTPDSFKMFMLQYLQGIFTISFAMSQ